MYEEIVKHRLWNQTAWSQISDLLLTDQVAFIRGHCFFCTCFLICTIRSVRALHDVKVMIK